MRAVDGKQEINLEWPNCLQCSSIQDCIRTLVQDEGFHLPSQEAKSAALNSATSLV